MSEDRDHPRDDLHLLLDDRLPPERRRALEAHVAKG